jgi:taurine dioxygenase
MALETRPLSPNLGAEVIGLDLTRESDETVKRGLLDTWTQAGLILVRDVQTPEAHMRLSSVFGSPGPAATGVLNLDRDPRVMGMLQDPDDSLKKGMPIFEVDGESRAGYLGWHWDQSFMPEIVRGAALRMVDTAARGGETGFIDAIAAYERLSPDLQRRIESLEVVYHMTIDQHRNRFGFPKTLKAARERADAEERSRQYRSDFPAVVHPLVITQRETGRKVLKLSPMHAQHILGLETGESDALLETLADLLVDPRYAYFHDWRDNDLLIWDNWRLIHSARGVPPEVRRYAERTTIYGDYGVGRYLDPALQGSKPRRGFVD